MPRAKFRHQETYKGTKLDLSANTERELAEKVRIRKNEIDKGIRIDGENMTFASWSELWLSQYKQNYVSEPHYKAIVSRMENYVIPQIGKKRLKEIKPIDVQTLLRRCDGRSFSLVSHIRSELSECLSQAVNEQYILFNPVANIKTPKNEAGSHRSLTNEERALLLKACEGHYAGTWIKMLLYCGVRPQETAPLRWKDVDVENHTLTINKALKADGTIGTTKSKSGIRTIPIPDIYFSDLVATLGMPEDLVFSTNAKADGSCGGLMLNHQSMRRRWESIKKEMQLLSGAQTYRNRLVLVDEHGNKLHKVADDLTLYCLRHTYCTDLLRAGVPITSAKYLMGHSDTKMIDKIYGHHTDDQSQAAGKLLNKFLNKANKV